MNRQSVRSFLHTYRTWIMGLAFAIFAYYASFESHVITAVPATYWMNMFSYKDYTTWEAFKEYLIGLRTGIPPALSGLEIFSYNLLGSSDWIFKGFYRKAIIAIVILPVFFSKRTWREMLWCLGMAVVSFETIIQVHQANPQYYDVLLPLFLLVYFLLSRLSFYSVSRWVLPAALLAGFCLTMAELCRPFMIAIFPFLLGLNLYHYIRRRHWKMLALFLLPILIFSGGWHAKLWHYNHQQVIWSNSSGTNLFRAWSRFVDQEALMLELQEEAPPIMEGRWQNINTQIHYENSQIRKEYVWKGIKSNPNEAFNYLWEKTITFIQPRTDMYANDPQAPVIRVYRIIVRSLFIVFPFLLVSIVVKFVWKPVTIFQVDTWVILVTGFISLMPIIGESGEEARFVISVVPLLTVCGMYVVHDIQLIARGIREIEW